MFEPAVAQRVQAIVIMIQFHLDEIFMAGVTIANKLFLNATKGVLKKLLGHFPKELTTLVNSYGKRIEQVIS